MIVAGLTGSIAMGKSATARMFAERGVPVFDSDAAVHDLYAAGGKASAAVAELAPSAMTGNAVDRPKLAACIAQDPALLKRIESVVHPLVRQMQDDFLNRTRNEGARLVILDIPLLFETGREKDFDAVIVVTAPAEIQRQRALARPGMTAGKLEFILSRQMPDSDKRKKADYIIDTSKGFADAERQVDEIIAAIGRDRTVS